MYEESAKMAGTGIARGQLLAQALRDPTEGQAIAGSREPGVGMELKLLHASLENLAQRVEHLFNRMEGALRPVPPANPVSPVGTEKEGPISPLAREIVIARNQVGRILGTINEIHARYDA